MATSASDAYAEEFRKILSQTAAGRETNTIQLYKPDGSTLGFSVVGVKNEQKNELGIFVQEIHQNGIAARLEKYIVKSCNKTACSTLCFVNHNRKLYRNYRNYNYSEMSASLGMHAE